MWSNFLEKECGTTMQRNNNKTKTITNKQKKPSKPVTQ